MTLIIQKAGLLIKIKINWKIKNYALKKKNIKNYSEALEVDPSNKILNAILCSNKAVVFMKLKNFKEALEECNKSIELNEKYYKVDLYNKQ